MRCLMIVVLAGGLLLAPAGAQTPGGGAFLVSPPVEAPSERNPDLVQTNLRELIDARGLALLVEDDEAAGHLDRLVRTWRKAYAKLLASDPELKRIDGRSRQLFAEMLSGHGLPLAQLPALVASIPRQQMTRTLRGWLQGLFHRRGISFATDLDSAPREVLADVCQQARTLDARRDLPAWRYRVLLWRWRDSQVKRLFARRDERLVFLTPVAVDTARLEPPARRALDRYLRMLRNLKVEVLRVREHPYERHRTLEGLLRGLRYMDTIRRAARLTGLDHRLLTGLFIQESEFVHRRVSVAGAFSVGQFLNIAIKDVWLFRHKIPGSRELLAGIGSWEELRQRMIDDPRMAIQAAFLYFRRVRDGIVRNLGGDSARSGLADLLGLEMYTAQTSMMERSLIDTERRLDELWPARTRLPLPVLPVGGVALPDPAALLGRWTERAVRELAEAHLSEQVFRKRLERLYDALGLAAYNAGTGNLLKTARRKHPYQALSFPLQIDETRGYVDGILDKWDILEQVDRIGSDVERMSYPDLMRLAERACRKAGLAKRPAEAAAVPAGQAAR